MNHSGLVLILWLQNLGEWWKKDIVQVYNDFRRTGGDAVVSDAYTINGQPGDLHPCSKKGIQLYNYIHACFLWLVTHYMFEFIG